MDNFFMYILVLIIICSILLMVVGVAYAIFLVFKILWSAMPLLGFIYAVIVIWKFLS